MRFPVRQSRDLAGPPCGRTVLRFRALAQRQIRPFTRLYAVRRCARGETPRGRPSGCRAATCAHSAPPKLAPRSTPRPMNTRLAAPQRLARVGDASAIWALMRSSVLDLFPAFYDERQTASAAVHIAHLDMTLIEDETYYVHEAGDEIVACGGWSRRYKLYTGSGDANEDRRLLDPRTESARVRAMFVRSDWTR